MASTQPLGTVAMRDDIDPKENYERISPMAECGSRRSPPGRPVLPPLASIQWRTLHPAFAYSPGVWPAACDHSNAPVGLAHRICSLAKFGRPVRMVSGCRMRICGRMQTCQP